MSETMKTSADHQASIGVALQGIEADFSLILDYSTLLGVLLAGPDAETALEGALRLVIRGGIIRHGDARDDVEQSWNILRNHALTTSN